MHINEFCSVDAAQKMKLPILVFYFFEQVVQLRPILPRSYGSSVFDPCPKKIIHPDDFGRVPFTSFSHHLSIYHHHSLCATPEILSPCSSTNVTLRCFHAQQQIH